MRRYTDILPERYQFISVISSGSFGDVMEVKDRVLGYKLALKVLKAFSRRGERGLGKEFMRLSDLNHPNLVKVYDYGLLRDGKPYFTMELVVGRELKSYFKRKRNLVYVAEVIMQALRALKYLHERGVLHGDIKPENIMITYDKKVKLLDFGLTVRAGRRRKRLSGTPGYIAPEVVGRKVYSESSDLYALGVTMLESILGREVRPWEDGIYDELLERLSGVGIKNASSLSSFILSLCSREIEERPESTEQAILSFEVSSAIKPKWMEIDFEGVFVGRERELSEAERFLMRRGNKRFLIIEGVVGVGKKALVREIKNSAQVKGFRIVELDALENISSPIEELFYRLAYNLDSTGSKILRDKVKEIYSIFKYDTSNVVASRLSEDNSFDMYINLSNLLMDYAKKHPVVIIIHNIELFGSDFLKFLAQLEQVFYINSNNMILSIMSLNIDRKYNSKKMLGVIRDHELSHIMKLNPLSIENFKNIINELLNGNIFIDKEVELIHEKSRGLPLHAVELIKQFITHDIIIYDGKDWIRNKDIYSSISSYSSVSETFLEKWQCLGREEKRILRIISFYDNKMNLNALNRLINTSASKLAHLVDIGMIYLDNGIIDFVNPLYREDVKKRTNSKQRKYINTLIALFLESSGSSDIVKKAKYWIDSKSIDMAYKYGIKAYKVLVSRNELYMAYRILKKLINLLRRRKMEKEFLETLYYTAEIEALFGQHKGALTKYNTVINSCFDPELHIKSLLNMGRLIYFNKGDLNEARKHYLEAVKIAQKYGNSQIYSLSLSSLSEVILGKNKEKLLLKSLEIVNKADLITYSVVLSKLISFYWSAGQLSIALKYIDISLGIVDKLPHSYKLDIYHNIWIVKYYSSEYKYIINNIISKYNEKTRTVSYIEKLRISEMGAGLYYVLGDYKKMISLLNDAINILMIQKAYYPLIIVMTNMLIAYMEISNYGKCISINKNIKNIVNRYKLKYYSSANIHAEAKMYALLGKYYGDYYIKRMRYSINNIKRSKVTLYFGHYYITRATYNYYNLLIYNTLINIDKAVAVLRSTSSRDDLCEALLKKAIILCELGEPKRAGVYIKKAWEIYGEIHCEYLKPQLYLARGMVERMNGTDEAIGSLREGLRVSKRQMTREQTWQIQREIALYYRGRRHLKRAIKYYRDAVETIKQITETIPTEEIKVSYLEVPLRKRVFEEIRELKREVGG